MAKQARPTIPLKISRKQGEIIFAADRIFAVAIQQYTPTRRIGHGSQRTVYTVTVNNIPAYSGHSASAAKKVYDRARRYVA